MKRPYAYAAAAAALIGLAGCDALINQQNLFEAFEPNLTENYSAGMSDEDLLSSLSEDSDSSSFYDDLSDDPELTDAIVGQLDGIVQDAGSSDEEVEEAAEYLSAIVLNTTEVGDVVNSLVGTLMDSDDSGTSSTEGAMISSLLSPIDDLLTGGGDSAGFSEFMDNIDLLAATYESLAQAITETGGTVSAELAQAAAVILVMDAVVSNIDSGDPEQALFDYLVDLKDDGTVDPANELSFVFSVDLQTTLLGDDATDTSLEILLNAAGLGSIADLIGTLGA